MAPKDMSLWQGLFCSMVITAGGGRGAALTPAPEQPGGKNGSDGTGVSQPMSVPTAWGQECWQLSWTHRIPGQGRHHEADRQTLP